MTKSCDDKTFIELFEAHGATEIAKKLGIAERRVYSRRERLEKKLGRQIKSPCLDGGRSTRLSTELPPGRVETNIKDGTVLVGSDAHYWPGDPSTGHRAFCFFANKYKPPVIVMNGDVIDGATASRHPPIGWQKLPSLAEEIEVAAERLHEIQMASPNSVLYWPMGNHDQRLSTNIALKMPEMAKVKGVELRDHFPEAWQPCWSLWINDAVVIKHKGRNGGVHAAYNSTVKSGKTTVIGHTHALGIREHTDYSGTRWGINTGCLADIFGPQFRYLEDDWRDWRAGFVMLTFSGGKLLPPELISVLDENHVVFRGQIIAV